MDKTYKFFREETQQWENVPLEVWQWKVEYADGSEFKQYGDDGIFHWTSEIDQEQELRFIVFSPQFPDKVFTLLFSPEYMNIVFFHRVGALGDVKNIQGKICFFGYKYIAQEKFLWFFHKETEIQSVIAITPDGNIVFTDDTERVNF